MRRESSINVLASMQQGRSLMGNTSLEHSVGIIATGDTLEGLGESRLCFQGIDIDGVEPVPTVRETLDLVGLVLVCLRRQIPGIRTGINDSSSLDRNIISHTRK